MKNLQIQLQYPWLLLLLIPAIALTLLPYFRLAKRHRRTRNRIISIVLHLTIMVLAIFTLCGMTFTYQLPNKENEIILLVDVSDSEEDVQSQRDEFVEFVLNESAYDGYKVGIVTFGFDQVYAAELTYDVDEVFDQYLRAPLPDTSATDIAAALNYTKGLFTNTQSSKIVLITDGKETDEDASLVIRSIAAQGIQLDVAEIGAPLGEFDAQISAVELPEYHMDVETEYTANVTIQTNQEAWAVLEVYDNGDLCSTVLKELNKGTQTLSAGLLFHEEGLHEISFKLSIESGDKLLENNIYYSYYYLEKFNKVLILERESGESNALVAMLNAEAEYDITVRNVLDENVPADLEALCEYDQVILNNISNADLNNINTGMEISFAELLEQYVGECGGGLFTVGGNKEVTDISGKTETVANAYNREDLYKTVYQSLLPVEAENYTPPLGVMVLLDISGSMSSPVPAGGNRLDWARDGVETSLEAMTARDYIGIMTFDSYLETILQLTPRTHEAKILEALNTIKTKSPTGGTVPSEAIFQAGQALSALDVSKRHIVLITDGGVASLEECINNAKMLYEDRGITLSVVGIDVTDQGTKDNMQKIVDAAGGKDAGSNLIWETADKSLTEAMRADLASEPLKEIEPGTFNPIVNNNLSPLVQDLTRLEENDKKLQVTLDGFYGVKARSSAEVVLMGEYEVPIYAQWKYGAGMVGSFMSDLNGVYSSTFMASPDGKTFIKNVVNNLMPTMSIRPNDITISLKSDNYINTLSVYTDVDKSKGEYLKGAIYDAQGQLVADMGTANNKTSSSQSCYITTTLNAQNDYSRCGFVLKKGGVYHIVITKYDREGNELAMFETYKTFSYSAEYDTYLPTEEDALVYTEKLAQLAESCNGKMIRDLESPWEIFEGFVTALDKVFDPRILFMSIAIALFLLDIVVRKFKFKWPHELIREYKAKKEENKKG